MPVLTEKQRLDRALIKQHEDDIYSYLLGSACTLDKVIQVFALQDVEIDTFTEVLREIDLFNCCECGWWCDLYDLSENEGEEICSACSKEETAL
jgi:hypothetical protein